MRRLLPYWWFKVGLGALFVFLLIQFVPYRVDNPPGRDEPRWDSKRTEVLAMRACSACHTNQTKVLWFEHVAPVSWYVANHVKEGRAALNFDAWSTAAGEGSDEPWEPLQEGLMPPAYYHYLGLHSDTKLTAAETRELVAGLEKTVAQDPPSGGG
ncbi:heme-binding domain-containing protein [soil metagenome]